MGGAVASPASPPAPERYYVAPGKLILEMLYDSSAYSVCAEVICGVVVVVVGVCGVVALVVGGSY